MHTRAALLLAVTFVAACGAAANGPTTQPAATGQRTPPPMLARVDAYPAAVVSLRGPDAELTFAVRVADTPERHALGLMLVPEVPEGAGMLFVFEEEAHGGFWMKDTLVALDIAFAAADGRVLAVLTMPPCEADPCPIHDPGVGYRYALEVAAGALTRARVGAGWQMDVADEG